MLSSNSRKRVYCVNTFLSSSIIRIQNNPYAILFRYMLTVPFPVRWRFSARVCAHQMIIGESFHLRPSEDIKKLRPGTAIRSRMNKKYERDSHKAPTFCWRREHPWIMPESHDVVRLIFSPVYCRLYFGRSRGGYLEMHFYSCIGLGMLARLERMMSR